MDFNMMSKNRGRKKNCSNKKQRSDSLMKVVYISSPMKVKTSAAKFRTIVQKLTGRDSDISDYMLDGGARINPTPDFEIFPETFNIRSDQSIYPHSSSSSRESPSPTSSDSQLEQATTTTTSSSSFPFGTGGDYLFVNSNNHQIGGEEQFFPSNLFGDSNYYLDMDVLGSYDAL